MSRRDRYNNRVKATGKGRTHSFLMLPHYLTDSDEFAALAPKAVKLLIEIARQYKGSNNGDLSVPWSLLERRGWRSQWTVQRARNELLAAEFIRTTRRGLRKMCSLYAITWQPVDECRGKLLEVGEEKVASNAWRKRDSNCLDGSKEPISTAATTAKAA